MRQIRFFFRRFFAFFFFFFFQTKFDRWKKVNNFQVEESARIRPADLATMELILSAPPRSPAIEYGIVVNKVSKRVYSLLKTKKDKQRECIAGFAMPNIPHRSSSICLVPRDDRLDGMSDVVVEACAPLVQYINRMSRASILPASVHDINVDDYDALLANARDELKLIKQERQAVERRMAMIQSKYDKRQQKRKGAAAAAQAGVIVLLL
jgi:hypothetical protein